MGDICLANTHPFIRELWGRYWVFAHNGQLSEFSAAPGFYEAVGSTDSEALFCDILNHLRSHCDRDTATEQVVERLVQLSRNYARQGVFNLLLSNGDWLFTFCTTKMASITRRAPFGPARLKDADVTVDFESETTPNDIVSVIVTEPLTSDETWDIYKPGEWRLWRRGVVVMQGSEL